MTVEKITIPDFGDVQQITVVEVFVVPGDRIEEEASLIALESEKAVMDLPSPFSGVIKEIQVKAEDVVKSGDVIALIETEEDTKSSGEEQEAEDPEERDDERPDKEQGTEGSGEEEVEETETEKAESTPESIPEEKGDDPAAAEKDGERATEKTGEKDIPKNDQPLGGVSHATPSVRAFARAQEVDLSNVTGTGPHGRILQEDVMAVLQQGGAAGSQSQGRKAPEADKDTVEDFSKYGEVEEQELGKIQKLSGRLLYRSWTSIPHVTHFDEADVTELERFRKDVNRELGDEEGSLSLLVFIIRAVAATLMEFPLFNCSLSDTGESVIVKKYYHLGIAVDTPKGLVVPVIKNVDRLGLKEIGAELKRLSSSARAGKLAIPDIQGATFTISSLGSIGGTGFTPIISRPQVAILGLSRSFTKPVWDGERFIPQQTLPFSVSYDHRVIDGAGAARFCKHLRMNIEDLKRTLL
ncbi:MAG: 2-oxo acid dehydrogenase subunit E2 [Desulforhopalus sp.]